MYAKATIVVERKTDAFLVPTAALVQEKSGTFVFTVSQGVAKKTRIKIGFIDSGGVEILDGLKADESVILAKGQTLSDGQPVRREEAK
jgi:HlyD family secretion protein